MWLVLSPSHDAAAAWACEGLRARGLHPVHHLTTETLAFGVQWEHRIDGGGAHVRLTLPNGLDVRSTEVQGVLNRLLAAPADSTLVARPSDRDYAQQELMAFFMSWLETLPGPVLNPPTAQGLSGAWRHPSEWNCLAAEAGLPTSPYALSSRTVLEVPHVPVGRVIVVDGVVVGSVPEATREGCRRLAALARTPLLGIDFEPESGTFAGATPQPELRHGSAPLLDALARALAPTCFSSYEPAYDHDFALWHSV